jgi:hypothetical protein
VFFWDLFAGRPFAALSVLFCLATIYSCIALKRELTIHIADRFLIGLVGLVAVYQGLRIVREVGLLPLAVDSKFSDGADLVVTLIFFQAPMILRRSRDDRVIADQQLRLAMAVPPVAPDLPMLRADLVRALPQLSDAAFKLYAYDRLNPPGFGAPAPTDLRDLERLRLLATEELDAYLRQLPIGTRALATHDNWKRSECEAGPLTVHAMQS